LVISTSLRNQLANSSSMTDETRDKLKGLVTKRPLQTAILITPEYERGFEQGRIQGKFEAIDHMLESMQSGQVQTWIAAIRHLEGLKEAAIRALKNENEVNG